MPQPNPFGLPQMEVVDSSNVRSIGYDAVKRVLYVRFLPSGRGGLDDGPLYQYQNVPPWLWKKFQASTSKGSYLSVNIKGQRRKGGSHKYPYALWSGSAWRPESAVKAAVVRRKNLRARERDLEKRKGARRRTR